MITSVIHTTRKPIIIVFYIVAGIPSGLPCHQTIWRSSIVAACFYIAVGFLISGYAIVDLDALNIAFYSPSIFFYSRASLPAKN